MNRIERLTRRETVTNRRGIFVRRCFHPLIRTLLTAVGGCKRNDLRRAALGSGPYLFAVNHSNGYDIPTMANVIRHFFFVLASDEPRGEIPGLGLWLNGVIWTNRASREDRAHAKALCIECLRRGRNLLVFPEGTWNLTPARPMLPLSWGVIEMAQAAGCAIVPVALEYEADTCSVNMGDPYFPTDPDKAAACEELRDKLATLRWTLWEQKGTFCRDEVSEADYAAYTCVRIREYGLLTEQQLRSWALERQPCPGEAFSHLEQLTPSRANAFLLREH